AGFGGDGAGVHSSASGSEKTDRRNRNSQNALRADPSGGPCKTGASRSPLPLLLFAADFMNGTQPLLTLVDIEKWRQLEEHRRILEGAVSLNLVASSWSHSFAEIPDGRTQASSQPCFSASFKTGKPRGTGERIVVDRDETSRSSLVAIGLA